MANISSELYQLDPIPHLALFSGGDISGDTLTVKIASDEDDNTRLFLIVSATVVHAGGVSNYRMAKESIADSYTDTNLVKLAAMCELMPLNADSLIVRPKQQLLGWDSNSSQRVEDVDMSINALCNATLTNPSMVILRVLVASESAVDTQVYN